MKWGLTQRGALLHLSPAKHRVYFHLARTGRGQGEVAVLSRCSGQGFSSACSLRSSYANGDRILGMSEASYRAVHSVEAFGSRTCHHAGTYLYFKHLKTLPPCWAVWGSHKHFCTWVCLDRSFSVSKLQTLIASYKNMKIYK